MATDLFERLAELEVPPPPEAFDQQLHQRVNRALVAAQLVDLLVRGLPWATLHFARAIVGFIALTITGHYDSKHNNKRR